MSNSPLLRIAIIGSGPSGYYMAEALTKDRDDIEVDIIDRLPTPFGLIRGGVAPDHQSIKAVSKRYEKTSFQDNVRFVGNMEIGRDVSLKELREIYDAVVIATGAPLDRPIGIFGDDKEGVYGSAEFVGWYNSHPDFVGLNPNLDVQSVAVIGNGNVAVDVVRVLAKTSKEMENSDLAQHAADVIHVSPLKTIHMFGRRGPLDAKFTTKELGELGHLENCVAVTKSAQLPDEVTGVPEKEITSKTKNLAHLKSFADNKAGSKPITLHIEFFAKPIEVLGNERVTGLKLERTVVSDGACIGTGEIFEIDCDMIVACIGYQSEAIEGAPFREDWGLFPNEDGKIEKDLYTVGWAKRGPSGTIGTNRPDAIAVAEKLVSEVKAKGREGRQGLDTLIHERAIDIVTFRDWKLIEEAEIKKAENDKGGLAPRVKFTHVKDMVELVKQKK